MKTLAFILALTALALIAPFSVADDVELLAVPKPPARTAGDDIADEMARDINGELTRRVEAHKRLWQVLWHNPSATPDEICAGLGTRAAALFRASALNLKQLGEIAALAGKTLADLGLADYATPPRQPTLHDDGTVTLAPPAPGHDAWGKPLPPAE